MSSRPVEQPAIFLDQVDSDGHHIAYVGCAGDMRTAHRMRAREAHERAVPESRITFSTAKES